MTSSSRLSLRSGAVAVLLLGVGAASAPAQETQRWDRSTGSWVTDQSVAEQKGQGALPYLSITRTIPNSNRTYQLHMISTRDEIHLPLGVRKPDGDGPFPVILIGRGNGKGGYAEVEKAMYELEPMMDMLIDRGYAVAYGNYRNEIPGLYNEVERAENIADSMSGGARALKSGPSLDSDDYIEIIAHLKALDFTDPEGVGTVGVSHSGELQLKAATVTSWGAAVPIEPAAHEFLAVDTSRAPRKGRALQLQDVETVEALADRARAKARLSKIDTPFLVMGRDDDHLQGLFRLTYDWLAAAGKIVEWDSFDHAVHGYGFLYRDEDGGFDPDAEQLRAFERWVAFFDEHLKQRTDTAAVD